MRRSPVIRVKGDHQEAGQRMSLGPWVSKPGHQSPPGPQVASSMKQKRRETEGTKESFNAGKIRKPQGLAIAH